MLIQGPKQSLWDKFGRAKLVTKEVIPLAENSVDFHLVDKRLDLVQNWERPNLYVKYCGTAEGIETLQPAVQETPSKQPVPIPL